MIPIAFLLTTLPVLFRYLGPTDEHTVVADPERLRAEDNARMPPEAVDTLGGAIMGWPKFSPAVSTVANWRPRSGVL